MFFTTNLLSRRKVTLLPNPDMDGDKNTQPLLKPGRQRFHVT